MGARNGSRAGNRLGPNYNLCSCSIPADPVNEFLSVPSALGLRAFQHPKTPPECSRTAPHPLSARPRGEALQCRGALGKGGMKHPELEDPRQSQPLRLHRDILHRGNAPENRDWASSVPLKRIQQHPKSKGVGKRSGAGLSWPSRLLSHRSRPLHSLWALWEAPAVCSLL